MRDEERDGQAEGGGGRGPGERCIDDSDGDDGEVMVKGIKREMDKLREEVAEVQVVVENDDGDRHLHMNTFVRSSLMRAV